MFKVVPDQLKVSMGWVRCGRCAEVFDAQAGLQSDQAVTAPAPGVLADAPPPDDAGAAVLGPMSLPTPGPLSVPTSEPLSAPVSIFKSSALSPRQVPRWIADAAQPASPDVASQASDSTDTHDVQEPDGAVDDDFDPAAWRDAQRRHQQSENGFAHSKPAALGVTRPAALDGSGSSLAPTEPAALHHEDVTDEEWEHEAAPRESDSAIASAAPAKHPVGEATTSSDVPASLTATPVRAHVPPAPFEFAHTDSENAGLGEDLTFVREARRNQRWQEPRVRRALTGLAIALALALGLQIVIVRRDEIAAFQPSATSWLQGLCSYAGCEIRPARQIEALVIDSSTFNKIGADVYRLSFVLKNTGRLALEVPALEVTLTDPQDQPLIRRVVIPAQFGAGVVGGGTLAARGELSGTLSMKVAGDLAAPGAATSSLASNLPVAGYRLIAFYP